MTNGTPVFDHDAVIEVYYGSSWYDVEKGTYQEVHVPDGGDWVSYIDKYNQATVVVPAAIVGGWKYLSEPKVVDGNVPVSTL